MELPGLPPTTNVRNGKSWRATWANSKKWKKTIREWIYLNDTQPEVPLEKAKITCIRHSSGDPDFDGLVGSYKNCIDALVECGIIANDKPKNIGQPTYVAMKAPPSKGRIEIIIEEIE